MKSGDMKRPKTRKARANSRPPDQPIADIYRAATGEGGDMINAFTNARTGETAATGAGLSEASSDRTAADGRSGGRTERG